MNRLLRTGLVTLLAAVAVFSSAPAASAEGPPPIIRLVTAAQGAVDVHPATVTETIQKDLPA